MDTALFELNYDDRQARLEDAIRKTAPERRCAMPST